MKNFHVILVLLCISLHSYADAPILLTVPDQQADQESAYEYQPSIQKSEQALWVKTYGPDDVTVNPITGLVSWDIPATLPSESFHIGVKASNKDGDHEEVWVLTVGKGDVVYLGPDEMYTTLKSAMSAISSGDTIIMRNGSWDHENKNNTIPGNESKLQTLPAGSQGAFTTLIAEDPGQVVIDGKNQATLISLWGAEKHPDWSLDNNGSSTQTNYIAIKGLVLLNSKTEAVRINNSKYIKLINIGVGPSASSYGGFANLYIYKSQYVLIEGLYVWGHGRYKVQFKNSSEGIVRRSVARIDNYNGGEPIGGYISYCSRNILFQNNILVDSDHSEYWGSHQEIINAFGVPATNCQSYPEYNEFKRSIALNVHMGLMNTDARDNNNPTLWEDIVGWDLEPGRHNGGEGSVTPILSGVGATTTNRMTLGELNTEGDYIMYSREQDSGIYNSLFYRTGWNGQEVVRQADLIRQGSGGMVELDYNNIFGFDGEMSDGTRSANISNTLKIDPAIKYVPLLPRDSELRTSGQSSSRIGAEVMTFLGASGTFYGEAGYDDETNIPMWPFPSEEVIHQHMSDFSFSGTDRNGGSAGIDGARGFAVNGQTLSNYIWGYLGHTVPPMNVKSVNGNKQVKIMWQASAPIEQSNITAYNIYDISSGSKILKGVVDSNVLSYTVGELENATDYLFAVTAVAINGNESDYGYVVESYPVYKSRPNPPVLTIN
jgi:hypothetical protein